VDDWKEKLIEINIEVSIFNAKKGWIEYLSIKK